MKKILSVVVLLILTGGGSFYGGIKYAEIMKSLNLTTGRNGTFNFRDGNVAGGFRRTGGMAGGANFGGEIISKDDNGATIKLRDGGSKIIFFSSSTQIMKFSAGLMDDLKIGENISINGVANEDGSVAARAIQLMPASTRF
jgi:hypothetical protein